ncbi:predicted protein [Naegleria gruberi]|uniref:Predicted protein n=1 Tax=Naegleria gruberi TaxID=5762 RepID=D2VZB3_NAEGR|nr:uncharacterized protein NAEGRDRAFT_74430 [Naegleria gruberi]EFC37762.1 predicted protein [Naegleria gruberi]|eukprot:XP_002670506.1 predicted protein [Naegleria gruberi strain NEG-M]
MEGVSKGAASHPVDVKGVISSKTFYKRTEQGNKYLTTTQDTNDLYGRIKGLTDSGSYIVVLPGSLGTAAELMIAWNLYYINEHFPATEDPVKKIFVFRGKDIELKLGKLNVFIFTDPWEKIIKFISTELNSSPKYLKW